MNDVSIVTLPTFCDRSLRLARLCYNPPRQAAL
jgi:hypothetical protein